MDYKYIEQLLERYWNCETSLEEEQILRSFFRQKEVPAHLLRYKQLFAYQDVEKEKGLGDDFDTRILTRIERPVVKAQRLTMRTRFMPLFKAAAMIAVLFLMGTVMQHAGKYRKDTCGGQRPAHPHHGPARWRPYGRGNGCGNKKQALPPGPTHPPCPRKRPTEG